MSKREIESDGGMRPFMLEPQHGTSSEADDSETVESDADREYTIAPWLSRLANLH